MEKARRAGGAGTVSAEAVRVRVALEARLAAAADPARRARLYELGQAIELFSLTGLQADEMAEMARESGDEMPQVSGKVAAYVAAHRALVPDLLAAIDADASGDSPQFAEIVRRAKGLEVMLRDTLAAFLGHADRMGVPMPEPDQAPPGPKPN